MVADRGGLSAQKDMFRDLAYDLVAFYTIVCEHSDVDFSDISIAFETIDSKFRGQPDAVRRQPVEQRRGAS